MRATLASHGDERSRSMDAFATLHASGLPIKVGPCISGYTTPSSAAAAAAPPDAPSATSRVASVAPIVM